MADKSIHEFKDAMATIKARGIVKTNILKSNAVYRYDFKSGEFKPMDKNKLMNLFNRLYLNSYDVNYSFISVLAELPAINLNQVDNYYKYRDALNKKFNLDEMQIQVKELLNQNNKNKKEFTAMFWKPQSQLQQLINKDVFTDGRGLYQFNMSTINFDYIYPKNLRKLFAGKEHLENLSIIDLQNNMGFFVHNLINASDLINQFRELHQANRILENYKKDYEVIHDLINSFD